MLGHQWFCPHCNQEIKAGSIRVVTPQSSMLDVVRTVATLHGVAVSDILGKSRFRHIVEARHDALRAVRARYPKFSSTQIGRLFNLDHSTVLYALGKPTRIQP